MAKKPCSHCGGPEAYSIVEKTVSTESSCPEAYAAPVTTPCKKKFTKCDKCGSEEAYAASPVGYVPGCEPICGCVKPKTCPKCVTTTCYPIPNIDFSKLGAQCCPPEEVRNVFFGGPSCEPPKNYPVKPKDVFARIETVFVFPDIDHIAQVKITNVVLADGQILDHPSYGPLVVHKLQDCDPYIYNLENAAYLESSLDIVGSYIDCGTEFCLGFLACPCEEPNDDPLGCNHLLEAFTVPEVDSTVDVIVDSVEGFVVGETVILRNIITPTIIYSFLLSEIIGPDTLVLQNTGQAGVAGTIYSPDGDGDGEFDFCVEPLTDQSICSQAVETACIKFLLGCDENGNLVKLQGETENQAPVYDTTCEGYKNKTIPRAVNCFMLTSCFQVNHVADICDQTTFPITTSDDQGLLDLAAEVLLSDNAEPQITICGYTFSLNLADSVVGAIVVTPVFNPDETTFFTDSCQVCIPEDCCFQCNPQIQYPVSTHFPPGFNDATTLAIPTNLLQTASGEYKLSVAKTTDRTANLLFYHNPVTNVIEHAYNGATGAEIPLGDLPGDVEDYFYEMFTYCNQETACPVDARVRADILARFFTLPDKMQVMLNYHTSVEVFQCDEVDVEGQQLTETSMSILAHFTGPTVLSTIAFGLDPWGTPAPVPLGVKPWDAFSGFNERTVSLFFPTCVVARTKPTIFIYVDPGWERFREEWAYASATTITIPAGGVGRLAGVKKVKFTQSGGEKIYTVDTIADTLLTVSGNVVLNEAIAGIYITDEHTIPPADDFIYLNMETTTMFSTQLI